ncbi:MAG: universal stress protein, partial [Flavobacteriales bacterium]|nr:universal stress protein [Flavobacteriales bacterium]
NYLNEEEIDLMIVFSKKRTGIDRLFEKRKALKFIGELPVPLLVIPINYELQKLKSVGLAIDQKEGILPATSTKYKVIEAYFGLVLRPFHVDNLTEEQLDFYVEPYGGISGLKTVEMVFDATIEKGIETWCNKENIDALCMITHNKNLLEKTFSHSVIRNLVKQGDLPILILTNEAA